MSKTIQITEDQYKRLFSEARMDGFRVDMLRGKSFKFKLDYCRKMLGAPIGSGSSRVVFQLDDETVLKLAKNGAGIAQNEVEARTLHDAKLSIIPELRNGSDTERYEWIITDYIIPATYEDFVTLLGVPFSLFSDIVKNIANSEDNQMYYKRLCQDFETFADEGKDELVEVMTDLQDYMATYNGSIGDLTRIQNWGIKSYQGEAYLVVLDSGLNDEVYKKYYRKW